MSLLRKYIYLCRPKLHTHHILYIYFASIASIASHDNQHSPQYCGVHTIQTGLAIRSTVCILLAQSVRTGRMPHPSTSRTNGFRGKVCKYINLVLYLQSSIYIYPCARARREKRSGTFIFTFSLINPITESYALSRICRKSANAASAGISEPRLAPFQSERPNQVKGEVDTQKKQKEEAHSNVSAFQMKIGDYMIFIVAILLVLLTGPTVCAIYRL